MWQALGPIPSKLLRRAQFRHQHYNDYDSLLPRVCETECGEDGVVVVAAGAGGGTGIGTALATGPLLGSIVRKAPVSSSPATSSSQTKKPSPHDVRGRLMEAAVKGIVRAVKAKHPNNKAKIAAAKQRGLTDAERAEVVQLHDLLQHVLVYDPERRLTAEQVLKHEFFRSMDG